MFSSGSWYSVSHRSQALKQAVKESQSAGEDVDFTALLASELERVNAHFLAVWRVPATSTPDAPILPCRVASSSPARRPPRRAAVAS
jgi:hypothetical protein